ncbi:MAG: nucleotidyltransferase family protein [Candidatus Nanoarchaeia archaeon]|nr:nucleotidyltransferase family protein [Candidatus Nanoarchaeia archaeon]MDD5358149.1 nucleotidyltransferase family protein [Candidatus Nanoarchaeia archaeon]MDD5589336.1 nucleotidyltransferase family protein [Candidatus Nanoarchaeia archaeon]
MRAILLSGGRGERLKPLTDKIQKVMVPINGKPLLQYWVELLKKYNIKEIGMNLNYLGEQIMDHFGDGKNFGVNVYYLIEETLLGTATPIKRFDKLYPGFCSEPFFVIYADNLSNMNLEKVISRHKKNSPFVTLTLHNHSEPWTRGIVNVNSKGKVLGFIEKPKKEDIISGKIRGESASCVYLFEPTTLKYFREEKEDLGTDLFPRLLEDKCPLYAFNPKAYVQDIGTLERYEQAKKDVAKFPKKFNV